MQFAQKLFLRGGSLLASGLVRQWMGTLDYKITYYDPLVDPAFPEGNHKKRIYIFWHEYIIFLLYLRRNCGLSMLLSRHRDADYLEQVAKIFGFGTVRGSSKRGGSTAILELMQHAENHHLAITPDGPRGPRRKLAPGCIFLASKLQLPIVPIGLGFDFQWRAPTWDRFAIPFPFSKARCVCGPEIFVPPNQTLEQMQKFCASTELLLNQLTTLAEDWALSGKSYLDQIGTRAGPYNEICYYPRILRRNFLWSENTEK